MGMTLNHLHFKTADPWRTAKWYVDHMGAKIIADNSRDGAVSLRIEIHGVPANVTGIIATQDGQRQHYGLEHIAIDTTTYEADCATLRADGSTLLEERAAPVGRRVAWWEGPDGMQLELSERLPKPAA